MTINDVIHWMAVNYKIPMTIALWSFNLYRVASDIARGHSSAEDLSWVRKQWRYS